MLNVGGNRYYDVYAGVPTAGKTYALKQLEHVGIKGVDTDELLFSSSLGFKDSDAWGKVDGSIKGVITKIVTEACIAKVLYLRAKGVPSVLITNLHHDVIDQAPRNWDGLFLYRPGADVLALMEQRKAGSSAPFESFISEWAEGWIQFAQRVSVSKRGNRATMSMKSLKLASDEYLSDYLTVRL